MEITRRYLPLEWEERWRREKERKKQAMEEGGEGVEQDNRELRRIVAYNDSRMGLKGWMNEKEGSEVKTSGTSWDMRREGLCDNVHTYHSDTHPIQVFQALKEFWDLSLLTDLTLITKNGNSFHVHSIVLAAVSSFILDTLKEKDRKLLDSNKDTGAHMWSVSLAAQVDCAGLQGVMEFAYTGAVLSLNRDTVAQIKTAAQLLGAPRVMDLCNEEERMKEEGSTEKEQRTTCAVEQMKITLQCIEHLRVDRGGCDVILDVDGASLYAHRVILAANSDYFRGMFTSGMRESHQTCVALPSLLAPELETLIASSYSGTLLLSWDNVFEITCTALQLQFQATLSLCLHFMHRELDASSCLDVASFAEAYGVSELLEHSNDFVLQNFWEVSTTAKFQDLPAEKLLDFLSSEGLCVPSELAVFRAVVFWVEADPEERLGQAGLLMTGVRFPLMTFREFREVRAVNLRMECFGSKEVELYGSALKQFGFSLPTTQDQCRIRRPKDALILTGGDQLNQDVGQRIPSGEVWFANSLRSGTGLVKEIEWRKLSEIPDKPKFRHGAAVMDRRLYVVGGCYFYAKDDMMKSAYSYDPQRNCWKRLADMQEIRSNFSLVVHEERLYALGGDKNINTNVDSVETYNPDSNTWSFVQPLDQPLSGYAAIALNGGIFISGGFNCKYVCLVSMFLYQPNGGTTYLADMTHDRAQHRMEALRGHVYVAGGVRNLGEYYTDQQACEVYDPVTDSWTDFAALPVPHVGAASAVLEGKIYILGGYCQDDFSESGLVHRFDPSTQRWESMGKLQGPVTDICACLLQLPQHLRQ